MELGGFEPGIGQFPPFWPIGFCSRFHWRFARSAFPPTTREKGKKEKRGGGKKGTPPGTSNLLKWMQRKDECNAEGAGFVLIARGEEETEWENKQK